MNVGSCARVMQEYGICDLKIVQEAPLCLIPQAADDAEKKKKKKKKIKTKEKRTTLTKKKKNESRGVQIRCAADWM